MLDVGCSMFVFLNTVEIMPVSTKHNSTGWFPFWFWNDTLTETEIRWQIKEMAAKGLRGFVPSPRQGLKQPYLSDSFFKMTQVAIDAAREHGMVVHLYDELPYPSGAAGGEVLLGNPHFYATSLVQQTFDVDGDQPLRIELPKGKILNCVACALHADGADWSRIIDLRSSIGVVLTEDSYQEVGLTAYNRKRYFSNVGIPTLETKLPPGRHRIFVSAQTTVENHKYYFHFVDALNPQAVQEFLHITHDRYFQRFGSEFGKIIRSIFTDETTPTWSERLPAEFFAITGYELPPLLPALQDARHPQHARVKADFHRVKYELFVESFEKPYAKWCSDHGIAYWGEKPLLRLSQLKYSDVPGCDAGHMRTDSPLDLVSSELRMNPRAAASAMYFYDKPAALCECYHSLGWGATLQDLKRLADGLLLGGITCFVPHAFFYSTHGLKKHDAPPSMFFQMPYWKFFGQMVRRTERVLAEFAGTHIAAQVLVVDPTPGVPNSDQSKAFVRLQHLLLESHVDYLLVDVEILQAGWINGGRLRIKDLDICLVIVPPMVAMEPALAGWLSRFESAGGKVVRFESQQLVLPEPSLEFIAESGDAKSVHLVTRKDKDRTLWFLQNAGNDAVELRFACEALGEIELDGVVLLEANDDVFRRRLEAHESMLLESVRTTHGPEARVTVEFPSSMQVTTLNANLLQLWNWKLTLDGQWASVQPAPIIHQLEKSGLRFAPRIDRAFGSIAQMNLPMLNLRYVAEFESAFTGPVELVMEPGSIGGQWTICINDNELASFTPTNKHVRGSLGVDVSSLIRPGKNRIVVDVQTNRVDGGLLNCLYLAGDFGVDLNLLKMVDRNPFGQFGNWDGLPFFTGVVEYRGTVQIAEAQPLIELPFVGDDAVEVSFNGNAWHSTLWTPRLIRVGADEIRVGENEIRVRVYTTMSRAFEPAS
jgi:alpha-L-rhamnosidase